MSRHTPRRGGGAALGLVLAVIVCLGLAAPEGRSPAEAGRGAAELTPERLGNPFPVGPYARNVWDMQRFGGRIYLGYGNSSNEGPDQNAGPVDVWAYDPAAARFVNEYTTAEEQIDSFRLLAGTLFIPGHDPRGSPPASNFYRREASGWVKVSTVPGSLHVYDLALFDNNLFAATGPTQRNAVMRSSDGGATWRTVLDEQIRAYGLFQFKGRLYAVKGAYTAPNLAENGVDVFDGRQFVATGFPWGKMLPGVPANIMVRPVRVTEVQGQLLYIGAAFVNDHQWSPLRLYVAPELDQAAPVSLPVAGALPYDILVRDGTVYVLAAAPQPAGQYTVLVYASADLRAWREQLRFTAATFARSFEEHDGFFYFGLGSDDDRPAAATGDILRVRWRQAAPSPSVSPATPTASPTPTRATGGEQRRRVFLPLIRSEGRPRLAGEQGVCV